jgi:predicted esterase
MEPLNPGEAGRPHLEESLPSSAPADPSAGRLGSRPHPPALSPDVSGLHDLRLESGRDGLLYVPAGYRPETSAPLVLMLHGAGGDARGGIDPFLPVADRAGLLLLAPDSRDSTWDIIAGSHGPDVSFIDRALSHIFDRYAVDATHVGIEGFSDGASYALSLGLSNGDLFTHVIAFSPGFAAPANAVGSPSIFMSHGTDDRVLPIDRTSRALQPRLERRGYELTYEEFHGGHVVPNGIAQRALDWFL